MIKVVYDRGSPDAESSQDENSGFDWRGAEGLVKPDVDILGGETGTKTKDAHLIVGAVRQRLLRKGIGA